MRNLIHVLLFLCIGCCSRNPASLQDFKDFLAVNGAPASHELGLTFFEVGLGDAILLEFPNRKTLLVDAGVGWHVDHIVNYLNARGIKHVDAMLLTHPHYDHYGGMDEFLKQVEVKQFLYNGVHNPAGKYQAVLGMLDERKLPRRVLRRGDNLPGLSGQDVDIEVLYPDDEALAMRSDQNGRTIVLRVTHGDVVMLLMGDAEKLEEKRLLAMEKDRLNADLIKLGHHASMFSGTRAFLEAVKPRVAIAQGTQLADIHPVYPRPSYYIRLKLKRMQVPLLTTKHEGAIQATSNGTSLRWRTMADSMPTMEMLRFTRNITALQNEPEKGSRKNKFGF